MPPSRRPRRIGPSRAGRKATCSVVPHIPSSMRARDTSRRRRRRSSLAHLDASGRLRIVAAQTWLRCHARLSAPAPVGLGRGHFREPVAIAPELGPDAHGFGFLGGREDDPPRPDARPQDRDPGWGPGCALWSGRKLYRAGLHHRRKLRHVDEMGLTRIWAPLSAKSRGAGRCRWHQGIASGETGEP